MKDIRDFILEGAASSKLYNDIFPLFELEPAEDYGYEKGDDEWYDEKKAYKILKDFLKDAKSAKILTNDPDNDLLSDVKVEVEKNEDFLKDEAYAKLPDGADWCGMDLYSMKVDGNKLYVSSATGQAANSGDGVEACIIKTV